jgi:hypothetical protein
MIDAPIFNRGAQRYARKRYGQAQQLGLVEGTQPGDIAAWWREFSKNPQAWNMGQQLQGQQSQQGVMGILGGQGQAANPMQQNPLHQMVQRLSGQMGAPQGGAPDMQSMRQDLLAQMMHAQEAQAPAANPLDRLAQRYSQVGQQFIGRQGNPILDAMRKGVGKPPVAKRRLDAVNGAADQARQLAQIMSKRLRGV